jgi:hypothetical protein
MGEVDIRYLLPDLRVFLYDITSPYTYTDETLDSILLAAVKVLGRRWHNRYVPTTDYNVQRSTTLTYSTTEPPVVEAGDEAVILLQAVIILKTAHAYDSVWDVVSWKDDEIAYSNIQGARSRDDSISRDLTELELLLKNRLHPGRFSPLHGFHKNTNETGV